MNPLPDKSAKPFADDEEDGVWDELPAAVSLSAEDEGAKEGEDEEDVMSERGWQGAVTRLEIERASPLPPDVRLTVDDLKLGDFPVGSGRRRLMRRRSRTEGSLRWIWYAGLGVMVMIIAAMGLFTMLNESNPRVNPLGVSPLVIEQDEAYPMGEHIADILARKDEAMALYGRFLRAESAGELLGMVRTVPGVEVMVRNPHRPAGLPPGWRVPSDAKWDVHTDQNPVFGVLSGYFPDDQKFQAFMTLEGGKLRLDWQATVRHCSMPFSQLVEGAGDASEMRVWVESATFYCASFPENEYRSYKIYSSLEDKAVWAFAKRETEPAQELARIFHKSMFGGDETKATMLLLSLTRGSAQSAPNQWLIKDVLHKAWVLP